MLGERHLGVRVDVNLDLIREEFGRVVYTHKTHEKARELCTRHATASKWVNIVLNALTFGGVLTSVTSENRDLLFVALFFATLTAGYTLYQLSFNPTQEAAEHRDAAKCLLKIRDGYIHLLADVEGNALSAKEIRNQRDGLSAQSQKVFLTAPDTSSKAYSLARRALKESEDFTFSDEEIDKFLPMNLRRTTQNRVS